MMWLTYNGGKSPYQFLWSNSSTDEYLFDMIAGIYSATVTDENGCTVSDTDTLVDPPLFRMTSLTKSNYNGYNVSCAGGSNGQITSTLTGGIPGQVQYVRYSEGIWRDFNGTISNIPIGQQTFRFKDAGGYAFFDTVITFSGPDTLELEISSDTFPNGLHVSCIDCYNGSITSTVDEGVTPYSYDWSNNKTTSSVNNLGPGDYSLIVTDANGCTISKEIELTGPESEDWKMRGNSGTDPDSQFVGTKDNQDLVLKTDNMERIRILADGDLKLKKFVDPNADIRLITVNNDGRMDADVPIKPPDIVTAFCSMFQPTLAWSLTNIQGPYNNALDVFNCNQRFGFGLFPQERVHINGFSRYSSTTSTDYLNIGHNGNAYINSYGAGDLKINNFSSHNIRMCAGGGIVMIGNVTPTTGYRLFVREGIRTEAIRVDVASTNNWSDHVFSDKYKIPLLEDIEKFVHKNKHLPGMPSAEEVVENGIDLAEMDSRLLEKIEELTLYIIAQDKRIKYLESELQKEN